METMALDTEFFNSNERDLHNVCAVLRFKDSKAYFNLLDKRGQDDFKKFLYANRYKVIVSFAAMAEARSLLALGINPLDFQWIDLYVEFRMLCNSNDKYRHGMYRDKDGTFRRSTPAPYPPQEEPDGEDHTETPTNLVNALFKLLNVKVSIDQKEEMRDLVLSKDLIEIEARMQEILEYCDSDTKYLLALDVAIQEAYKKEGIYDFRKEQLERGRYSVATALCENIGLPIDMELLGKIMKNTEKILNIHKEAVNQHFLFFKPEYQRPPKLQKNGKLFHYKIEPASKDMGAYQDYVAKLNIPNFPRTKTGKFKADSETLEEFGYSSYGEGLEELWKFNKTDSCLKWFKENNKKGFFDRMGSDNRVRPYFGIFGTQTGRNAASAKTFPFAMSSWLRCIIRPPKGRVIVGADFSQQEVYVAAVLSGDTNLFNAYLSGDVYLDFAKQANMVPKTATKKSHKFERNLCKSTVLGLQFGMGLIKLHRKLIGDTKTDVTLDMAKQLIQAHKTTFSRFWQWVYEVSENYKAKQPLITNDGWVLFPDNPVMTSVRNFLVQGNSASITRRAIVKLTELGLDVLCGLHDAIYVECDEADAHAVKQVVEKAMKEATAEILNEKKTYIRIDTKIIHHEDVWTEEKGINDIKKLAPLIGLNYIEELDDTKNIVFKRVL